MNYHFSWHWIGDKATRGNRIVNRMFSINVDVFLLLKCVVIVDEGADDDGETTKNVNQDKNDLKKDPLNDHEHNSKK
ncbi:hypothetical protein RclHR1_01520002 [Rhizophagus clarus]|uniref:Uncharacterized protein n=1 Tax=Rhizophagus clarus TaxID=94130 RepID=A0A2Z6QEI4_9GLOM|nr:hypothetical protein RclHR1_01520002 [Rhizophagus clarus]GES78736.1 hypothetical protein RCL_jg21628.t1 [Rhizophagus clarus]